MVFLFCLGGDCVWLTVWQYYHEGGFVYVLSKQMTVYSTVTAKEWDARFDTY